MSEVEKKSEFLKLVHFQQMSVKEAAKILEITYAQAKSIDAEYKQYWKSQNNESKMKA